jgi:hypothetical protein
MRGKRFACGALRFIILAPRRSAVVRRESRENREWRLDTAPIRVVRGDGLSCGPTDARTYSLPALLGNLDGSLLFFP